MLLAPFDTMKTMSLDDYKVVLYRNEPSGWVAEVPSIPGCHALMPTPEAALTELTAVFQMISDEYAERNQVLPADTTEILHA
jgi:predicted RNase H-like HicB family nuclease